MQICQEIKYRSPEPKIGWRCHIKILFHEHQSGYSWEIWDSLNDQPHQKVRSSESFYECEAAALKDADREAEDFVESLAVNDPNQVHSWFGSSYANYLVLPRSLMQAMPGEWQNRFVELMEEFHDSFDYLKPLQDYEVKLRQLVDEVGGEYVYEDVDDPLANYRYPPDLTPYRPDRPNHD